MVGNQQNFFGDNMTRIATMGTSSCATIAIAGFKAGQMEVNEEYRKDPDNFVLKGDGLTVEEFYSKVLYPTTQPLGNTKEYPFDMLMKELDASSMNDKFIIVTLNAAQYNQNSGYWPERLKEHGFEVMDKTKNAIGSLCYIFVRNKARRD